MSVVPDEPSIAVHDPPGPPCAGPPAARRAARPVLQRGRVDGLEAGCGWPLRAQLLNEQTTSAQRPTTVPATWLALMLGGLLGSLALPRLAEAAGNPAGLLTSAVPALLIALVSLRLRPRRPGTPGTARVAALHG